MKLHINTRYPDNSDTFWIPKIKCCYDSIYSQIGVLPKTCHFGQKEIKSGDVVQIWADHSEFICERVITRSSKVRIFFTDRELVIITNMSKLSTHDMIQLSEQYGCYSYGDFVEYCVWLCNQFEGEFRGRLIYWS